MKLVINKASDKFTSLLTYNSNSNTIPKLYIDSITFISFISNSNGAILSTYKSIIITFNNCIFNSSYGNTGGLLYFNNTKYNSIIINNCQFNNNKAIYGGAISFYYNNYNISIINTRFYNNSGIKRAGAIYYYGNN